nr:MAG TPA: hypothetical protein [Caudoviricetes sp.]
MKIVENMILWPVLIKAESVLLSVIDVDIL